MITLRPSKSIENAQEVFLSDRYIGVLTWDDKKKVFRYGFNGFVRNADTQDEAIDILVGCAIMSPIDR